MSDRELHAFVSFFPLLCGGGLGMRWKYADISEGRYILVCDLNLQCVACGSVVMLCTMYIMLCLILIEVS